MYSENKKNGFLKFIIIFLILILVCVILYNLYVMYENIDINSTSNYTTNQLSLSTDYTETVDSATEKSETIAEMLENVTQSVVGISKLTSAGRFNFKQCFK